MYALAFCAGAPDTRRTQPWHGHIVVPHQPGGISGLKVAEHDACTPHPVCEVYLKTDVALLFGLLSVVVHICSALSCLLSQCQLFPLPCKACFWVLFVVFVSACGVFSGT